MSGVTAICVDPDNYPWKKKVVLAVDRYGKEVTARRLPWQLSLQTYYLTHRGPHYCGLALANLLRPELGLDIHTHKGNFRDAFAGKLDRLSGTHGIGHISDSTRQPMYKARTQLGSFAICFDGNVLNREDLIAELVSQGHSLDRDDDISILAKIIALEKNFQQGLERLADKVEGAYFCAILTSDSVWLANSPSGQKPAVLGICKNDHAFAASSESCSFANTDFELYRDILPGEIIRLQDGLAKTAKQISGPGKVCGFELIYTADPGSVVFGVPVTTFRKRMGAKLAEKDIAAGFTPDIVLPVPDSGRYHAIGYIQAWIEAVSQGRVKRCPLLDELLIKYTGAKRSFTGGQQQIRNQEADTKLRVAEDDPTEIIQNLLDLKRQEEPDSSVITIRLVLVDDSIVRGTQMMNNLVPKIRSLLLKVKKKYQPDYLIKLEIHIRVSNPKLMSYCPYSKSTKPDESLAAVDEQGREIPTQIMAQKLGVDSLVFNTNDDIADALGREPNTICLICNQLAV